MYSLKIENTNGEIFELTHDFSDYYVTKVEGLTPPATRINTAKAGIIDGTFFNSASVEERNIVISLTINGDIEANRQKLYRIFPRKTACTVYFKNANRDVKIKGYVETIECDPFVMREKAQISIICPRPYFEDLATIYAELAATLSMFEFPFAIEEDNPIPFSEATDYPVAEIINEGDAEAGCIISIEVNDTIQGIKIINTSTQQFFYLDSAFVDHDKITISTISGQMGVTREQGGTKTNILNYVGANSTWLRLAPGVNYFTYTIDDGDTEDVEITFEATTLYGGV
jgi:hypothetical protein